MGWRCRNPPPHPRCCCGPPRPTRCGTRRPPAQDWRSRCAGARVALSPNVTAVSSHLRLMGSAARHRRGRDEVEGWARRSRGAEVCVVSGITTPAWPQLCCGFARILLSRTPATTTLACDELQAAAPTATTRLPLLPSAPASLLPGPHISSSPTGREGAPHVTSVRHIHSRAKDQEKEDPTNERMHTTAKTKRKRGDRQRRGRIRSR